MRTVTTALGTYEIPTKPRRVLAVDARTDLELALAPDLIICVDADNDYRPDNGTISSTASLAPTRRGRRTASRPT